MLKHCLTSFISCLSTNSTDILPRIGAIKTRITFQAKIDPYFKRIETGMLLLWDWKKKSPLWRDRTASQRSGYEIKDVKG